MSANLHELTKQLDVLSWNSRSVLNALIRSVMRAGSSNGFAVTRAGVDISLSRDDISRIYDFYEAWEASGYATGTDNADFYALVDEVGSRYDDGALVESLVKHAQIMMMDNTNVDYKYQSTYWLDKVANIENPKWFTNTAPIPLSIRTPIYDENLSTKHFDEYETYLFPSGYYSVDTLGYSGDGFAHSGGGSSWNFNVDNSFTISADRIILGDQEKTIADKFESSYTNTSPLYSLAGGYSSFAYGLYSIAFGKWNQAYGSESATIGGISNTAYGLYSGILGGRDNVIISSSSAIVGGSKNIIVGHKSFATNSSNHVGGYNYNFIRQVIGGDPNTDCAPDYTDENGCVYHLATTETSMGAISLGLNEIFISDGEIGTSLIEPNKKYSAGYNDSLATTPFDFRLNDGVVVHSYQLYGDKNVSQAFEPLIANVVAVQKVDGGYIVRLNKNLDNSNIPGLGTSSIVGGKVSRYYSRSFVELNPNFSFFNLNTSVNMAYSTPLVNSGTDDCSAFGYNTISCGACQTVIGSSNQELQRPRFIVGVGSTSYIASEDDKLFRKNALVVAPEYMYGTTSTGYVMFGTSNFSTVDITQFGDGDDTDYPIAYTCRSADEDFFLYNIEKYAGFYAYVDDPKLSTRAVLRVYNEKALLTRGNNGIQMQRPNTYGGSDSLNVQTELFANDGSIAIHSSTVKPNSSINRKNPSDGIGWKTYGFVFSEWENKHNVEIWAEDEVGICGNTKLILTAGSISGDGDITEPGYGFGDMEIRAFAYKSLTAWPFGVAESYVDPEQKKLEGLYAYPINYSKINRHLDTITDCGHYYSTIDKAGLSRNDPEFGRILYNGYNSTVHMFVSSQIAYDTQNNPVGFDVSSLVLPGGLLNSVKSSSGSANLPHPFVSIARVNLDGTATSRTDSSIDGGYIVKELAYRSDAENFTAKVLSNVGVPAYTNYMYPAKDDQPLVNYGTDGGYMTADFYLESLKSASGVSDIFWDCGGSVDIDAVNRHENVIIRNPKSFANYAGQCTTTTVMSPTGTEVFAEQYFVNGVKINPLMRASMYDDDNEMMGVTYMAYAPANISIDGTNPIASIYGEQIVSTTGSLCPRTLHTSKFSNGVSGSTPRNDMYNVWWLYKDNDTISWAPAMTNLVMAYSGGRLVIDFDLRCDKLNALNAKALPVTEDTSDTTGAKYVWGDTAKAWNDNDVTQVFIDLPVNPEIGNYLSAVPFIRLFGYCVGVGSGNPAYGITGNFVNEFSPLGYESNLVVSSVQYKCPMVRIYLGTITSIPNYESAQIPIHLEGLVNYVY